MKNFDYEELEKEIFLKHNELTSLEIKHPMTPSKIIDEESKSYIKEIIDNCKIKKENELDKNLKSNMSKYIKGNPNLCYKDIKLKKEYYKNNEHIKKLKTEDLIEIAKRRREQLNKNRYHKIEEYRVNGLKTEQNRQINLDYDIEIDNCTLNKNKNINNKINTKEEYLSPFISPGYHKWRRHR